MSDSLKQVCLFYQSERGMVVGVCVCGDWIANVYVCQLKKIEGKYDSLLNLIVWMSKFVDIGPLFCLAGRMWTFWLF